MDNDKGKVKSPKKNKKKPSGSTSLLVKKPLVNMKKKTKVINLI